MILLRVGVFSIKQILYCPKHEFDIEATGGHFFKDRGFMQKRHDCISIDTRTFCRHVAIAQLRTS